MAMMMDSFACINVQCVFIQRITQNILATIISKWLQTEACVNKMCFSSDF